MDSDGLPIVGPAIDLTKVGSINQKRTIAFLNHFIAHTVSFLNRFSCVCEELASIPGLENVTVQETNQAPATPSERPVTPTPADQESPQATSQEQPVQVEEPSQPVMTVAKDPRYAKYFQMMKVGVPSIALRPKVLADGLDPDLLETPDAPAPGGGQALSDDDDEDDSTASSFSDDD